jgi:hypothetical protein
LAVTEATSASATPHALVDTGMLVYLQQHTKHKCHSYTGHARHLFLVYAATELTPQPWRQCCGKLMAVAGDSAQEVAQLLTVFVCLPVHRNLLCNPASRGTLALAMLLSLCTDHAGCNGWDTWQQAAPAWRCRRVPAAEPADTQHTLVNTPAGYRRHNCSN